MLYQRVVLPQGVFNLPSKTILPAFQHLQTLTPLIVSLPSLDVLSSIPISHLSNYVYAVEGFSLQDEEAIYRSLDQGLYLAIVHLDENTTTLTPEEQEFLRSLPRNRIGLSLSTSNMELIINQYRNLIHHFIVRDVSSENFTQTVGWLRSALKVNESPIEVYLNFVDSTIRCGERVALLAIDERLHILDSPKFYAEDLATNPTLAAIATPLSSKDEPDIVNIFQQTIKTDRMDGLFTTVIVDENEKCLGLVYSNHQSLRQAFFEQKGIYWSRSRNSLWRKGDVSGMGQGLLQIRLDCDRDAVRMKVVQHGQPPAFCHLVTRTCWGNDNGLTKMERVLKDRKLHAPEGSYTKRLFDDEDLLRKKLLEEVQELVEAKDHDHIAAEAADVLYFLMTRCVAADVSLVDIERQLDLRSWKLTRRPGNAKDWRTQEAEKILNKDNKKEDPSGKYV